MSKNETKGWICPKCGRVYAPGVDKCQYCGGSTITNMPSTCPYQWWWNNPIYTTTTTTDSITLNTNGNSSATTTNSTLTNEVKC